MVMMCIVHPKENRYISRNRDFIAITSDQSKENHCAAELLGLFDFWTYIRRLEIEQMGRENEAIAKMGGTPLQVRSLWLAESLEAIHEGLLGGHSRNVIRSALELLIDRGFLKRRNNPGRKVDRLLQYEFQIDAVQAAVNLWAETLDSAHSSDLNYGKFRSEPSQTPIAETLDSAHSSNLNDHSSDLNYGRSDLNYDLFLNSDLLNSSSLKKGGEGVLEKRSEPNQFEPGDNPPSAEGLNKKSSLGGKAIGGDQGSAAAAATPVENSEQNWQEFYKLYNRPPWRNPDGSYADWMIQAVVQTGSSPGCDRNIYLFPNGKPNVPKINTILRKKDQAALYGSYRAECDSVGELGDLWHLALQLQSDCEKAQEQKQAIAIQQAIPDQHLPGQCFQPPEQEKPDRANTIARLRAKLMFKRKEALEDAERLGITLDELGVNNESNQPSQPSQTSSSGFQSLGSVMSASGFSAPALMTPANWIAAMRQAGLVRENVFQDSTIKLKLRDGTWILYSAVKHLDSIDRFREWVEAREANSEQREKLALA